MLLNKYIDYLQNIQNTVDSLEDATCASVEVEYLDEYFKLTIKKDCSDMFWTEFDDVENLGKYMEALLIGARLANNEEI